MNGYCKDCAGFSNSAVRILLINIISIARTAIRKCGEIFQLKTLEISIIMLLIILNLTLMIADLKIVIGWSNTQKVQRQFQKIDAKPCCRAVMCSCFVETDHAGCQVTRR